MKIKDLTPLTVVYLHRRGKYGSRSKVVVLDTEVLWTRNTYSSSRTLTRSWKGRRAEDNTYGHTTGVLVLSAHEETADKVLLELAAKIVLDDVAASWDQVEAKLSDDLEAAKANIGVVLPTRILSTWTEHIEQEKADREAIAEQNREESKRHAVEAKQRARVNELARQFDVPLKLDRWDRKATLSMPDMIALLERLGAAEGKL